jgi:hypothetical protein
MLIIDVWTYTLYVRMREQQRVEFGDNYVLCCGFWKMANDCLEWHGDCGGELSNRFGAVASAVTGRGIVPGGLGH